jgi:hypothetical protein
VRLDGSRFELPKYGWTTDEIELICNWMIPQNQIGVLDNINRVDASSDTRRLLYVNDKLYLCLMNGDRHLIPREGWNSDNVDDIGDYLAGAREAPPTNLEAVPVAIPVRCVDAELRTMQVERDRLVVSNQEEQTRRFEDEERARALVTATQELNIAALCIASTSVVEPTEQKEIERRPEDDPRMVPPIDVERNPFRATGTTMQCPVEAYDKMRKALCDTGAMFPLVRYAIIPTQCWERRRRVQYTVDGIGGEEQIEYMVPLRIKLGRGTNPGVWLWALVVEKLPFEACDVLLDNQTVMLLVSGIDATDIDDIGLMTRSGEELKRAIARIAKDTPGMTPLVPRVYSLDQ